MFGNESSPLISVMGTKVPGNESSQERMFQGTKVPRNESSRERKFLGTKVPSMELSFLGTKVPWYESSSYRSHSAPLLRQLHWLPITSRVQYKLCLLMYDVLHGTAPSYTWQNCATSATTIDYVPDNAGTLLSSEQERGWQTTHSPWQGLQLGTPCLLNCETPHLGLRFYHISKLTCTIIILTALYKFLSFVISVALALYSSFLPYFSVHLITACLCCMMWRPCASDEGARANDNDMIW